jgi:hypothetical protein
MKRSINNFVKGLDFATDALGFSVPPLCTVTTCETLPIDGTKVYASQGKGPNATLSAPGGLDMG